MSTLPPDKKRCHHTGFKKSCRGLVTKGYCDRWMHIQGTNPNTGESVNESKCVDDWMPLLTIENSQQQRQTGAAVESFRNEMVKLNQQTVKLIASDMRRVKDVGQLEEDQD